MLLLFNLLLHLGVRYFQDAELILLLIKHPLHYFDLLLKILLYAQLYERVLIEEPVEFVVRAAFPHLYQILALVLLPLNLFIFRQETLQIRHLPQFFLFFLH